MSTQGERLLYAMRLAGYKKVAPFAEVCDVKPGTLRQQIERDSIPADAAGLYVRKLRRVGLTLDWLLFSRGLAPGEARPIEPPPRVVAPGTVTEIPVNHYIGAGDVVNIIDTDDAFDWTEAPPGFEKGAAGIIRGGSGKPAYDDGEILFWRELRSPPKEPADKAVIVKVKDGPLYLKKLLPGRKRGFYHLTSINPATPVLRDQEVEAIAPVGWVKKSESI